jgi:tetratricopeptide (TPR) repeat protein
VIVVTAPIAIGGMLPWAQALWSIAAIMVLAAAAGVHGATGARWRWEATTIVLFLLAALSLLRATPVFAFNSGNLERDIFALWDHVEVTGTVAPGRAPLAALRLLGIASIFQLASVRFRGRDGSSRAARIALGACGLTILIGVLHAALGLGEVYGFYDPQHLAGVRVPLAAPFINENQAGAMWGLAAVLLVGVAVYDTKRRVFAMLGATTAIVCTEFVLRSHGGAVAAVSASIMMVVGINLPEMKSRAYGMLLGGAGTLVLASCALVAWLVAPRFGNESVALVKADIWQDSLLPALSKPLGFGPGAYGDLFGAYASRPWNTRFAFVESAPIQIAVDHGVIAALAMLGCFGIVFWRRMRFDAREERDLRSVTLGLVTYIGVEAITGMGLEGIGYAFPVALLAGMTAGRSIERSKQNAGRASVVAGTTALLVITGLSLGGLPQSIQVGDDHVGDLLSAVSSEAGRESETMRETMRALASAVPADTMLLTYALSSSLRDNDLDRAEDISEILKVLAPGRPVTWDFAVDVHMGSGDTVAACAAIHQMVAVGGEGRRVVSSLQRVTANPMDWQQCAEHADSLDAIYEGLHAASRTDDAFAIAIRELRRNPSHPSSLRAAFRGYLAMDLPAQAVERGLELLVDDPGDREVVVHTSQQLVRLGRFTEALTTLDHARASDPSDVRLRLERLAVLFQWEGAPNRVAEFEQEYQQLLAYSSRDQGTVLRRLRLGAAFFVQEERWSEAENTYRAILRLHPNDPAAARGLERATEER